MLIWNAALNRHVFRIKGIERTAIFAADFTGTGTIAEKVVLVKQKINATLSADGYHMDFYIYDLPARKYGIWLGPIGEEPEADWWRLVK